MDKIPEDGEVRKPLRKRQPERSANPEGAAPFDLDRLSKDWDVEVKSKVSRIEVAHRLQAEKDKSDHDLRKDFALFLVVLGIVMTATMACLFIVLSNRYPANIQNSAMALLAAIVSGGVGYATGKSSR